MLVWVALLTAGFGATRAFDGASTADHAARQALAAAAGAQHAASQALAAVAGAQADTNDLAALTARVARDERQSCLIQQRQLPAGRVLSRIMVNIHGLLSVPATRAQRRAGLWPPSPRVRRLLHNLNVRLGQYRRLERRQPRTRHC